jgi:hypothetical protein
MPHRLLLVLLIWVAVAGLAVDLLDLRDDVMWPSGELQQALEPEPDEFRSMSSPALPASDGAAPLPLLKSLCRCTPGGAPIEHLQARARPVHDRLSVYRI